MPSHRTGKLAGLFLIAVTANGVSNVADAEPVTCKFQFGKEYEACLELQRCRRDCSTSSRECLKQITSTFEQDKQTCIQNFRTHAANCRQTIASAPRQPRSNEVEACITKSDSTRLTCITDVSDRRRIEWQLRSPLCSAAKATCDQQCDIKRNK